MNCQEVHDEGPPAWREADCFEQSACKQRTAGLPVSEGAPAALPREPRVVSSKINALVDEIANLSLLEVSDLNWALKKRLNIPDAPMMSPGMIMAAMPAAAAEDVPQKKTFKVTLAKFDDTKKIFVETAPCTMKEDMSKAEAYELAALLTKAGGTCEIA
ncbi:hypothetical protein PRIPAC_92672 [Pristionchus pacificus]|uniref:Ribosomal protein n=1 Tax=Pristionchus pacificus TaxID=54126 RepID=A0A2A6BPF5_PRIPA|nr:hypothetical protein PRIPAC_92672 [Pristionchus pacificus]|eukprot:PDM67789.1 ribosomal protein [Pristionchus pacificus]